MRDSVPALKIDWQFASLRLHAGHKLTMLDDLEALGYMLVFFLKGKLP